MFPSVEGSHIFGHFYFPVSNRYFIEMAAQFDAQSQSNTNAVKIKDGKRWISDEEKIRLSLKIFAFI